MSISTDELTKRNTLNHMELNKTCTGGYDEEVTKRFQAMCLIVSNESERYSGIWNNLNNINLLGTDN